MTTHREFMIQLLETCKEFHWSSRSKTMGGVNGFIVSPPSGKIRPGHATVFIFQPKEQHERKVLVNRLRSAGLPISIVENCVKSEEPTDMATPLKPTTAPLAPAAIEVRPSESTLERIRRKVCAIADLCAEVAVDLDQLAQERTDIDQLKTLMKKIGG